MKNPSSPSLEILESGPYSIDHAPVPHVLFAEDERLTRQIVRGLLVEKDLEPVACESGKEAWERYQEKPFSFVITDWEMPECSGLELCRKIKSHPFGQYTYVLFVTGRNHADDLHQALQAGADDYLFKPIDPKAFGLRIEIAKARAEALAFEHSNDTHRRLNDKKYRLLFHNRFTATAIVELPSGRHLEANPSYLELFRHTLETVQEASLYDLAVHKATISDALETLRDNEDALSLKPMPMRRRDGSIFLAEAALGTFTLDQRHLCCCIIHDVTERHEQARALADNEMLLRATMEGGLDAFMFLEPVYSKEAEVVDYTFKKVNRQAELLLRRTREQLVGARVCELFPETKTFGVFERYMEALETNQPCLYDFSVDNEQGEHFAYHLQIIPVESILAVTIRDMSDYQRQKRALEQSEARFRAAAEGSFDSLLLFRCVRDGNRAIKDFVVVYTNQHAVKSFHLDEATVVGRSIRDTLPGVEELGHFADYRQALENGKPMEKEVRLPAHHSPYTMEGIEGTYWNQQVVPFDDGLAITIRDITLLKKEEFDLRRSERRFRNQALHDPLTELPNRYLLADRLQQAIAEARRDLKRVAVLLIDLNGFKAINDTYGHVVGDKFLQGIASRLQACVREQDTVARLGGDEFIVIQRQISDRREVSGLCKRIIERFDTPIMIDGQGFKASFGIGISFFPDDCADVEDLIKGSDAAMYHAKSLSKERGRSQYVFTGAMDSSAVLPPLPEHDDHSKS